MKKKNPNGNKHLFFLGKLQAVNIAALAAYITADTFKVFSQPAFGIHANLKDVKKTIPKNSAAKILSE